MGDGDDASKERLGCARSIDWQPTSASASGDLPRPPVPVSFIVFLIPRRSDLERMSILK